MIPDNMRKIINKLYRLDPAAAKYVEQRVRERSMNITLTDHENVVASFFSWASTPQHHAYWHDLNFKYNNLPNITKKGNSLE